MPGSCTARTIDPAALPEPGEERLDIRDDLPELTYQP
jgi:hypothetical protein